MHTNTDIAAQKKIVGAACAAREACAQATRHLPTGDVCQLRNSCGVWRTEAQTAQPGQPPMQRQRQRQRMPHSTHRPPGPPRTDPHGHNHISTSAAPAQHTQARSHPTYTLLSCPPCAATNTILSHCLSHCLFLCPAFTLPSPASLLACAPCKPFTSMPIPTPHWSPTLTAFSESYATCPPAAGPCTIPVLRTACICNCNKVLLVISLMFSAHLLSRSTFKLMRHCICSKRRCCCLCKPPCLPAPHLLLLLLLVTSGYLARGLHPPVCVSPPCSMSLWGWRGRGGSAHAGGSGTRLLRVPSLSTVGLPPPPRPPPPPALQSFAPALHGAARGTAHGRTTGGVTFMITTLHMTATAAAAG